MTRIDGTHTCTHTHVGHSPASMRVAFVLLAIVCVVSGRTLWHQLDQNYTFDKYCAEHGRDYAKGSEEYLTRSALFTANLQRILAHNADPTKTWKVCA